MERVVALFRQSPRLAKVLKELPEGRLIICIAKTCREDTKPDKWDKSVHQNIKIR